jgi:hypothetical protein
MWSEGSPAPVYGIWKLAPHIDFAARAFVRLHRALLELNAAEPIECLAFEEAIPPHQLHGHTNVQTVMGAAGLAAHCMSFAEAVGCRWTTISIAAWRRHWIGSMPRGTKSADLKHLAMQRARELGFNPEKHDAAEAIGQLDYQLSVEGIVPPWRIANVLQEQLRPLRSVA